MYNCILFVYINSLCLLTLFLIKNKLKQKKLGQKVIIYKKLLIEL